MSNPQTRATPLPQTGVPIVDAMTTGYQWILEADRTVDWSISDGFGGEKWLNASYTYAQVKNVLDGVSYYADIKFNYVGYYSSPSTASLFGSEINVSLSGSSAIFPSNNIWALGFFPNSQNNSTWYNGAPGDIFLNINSQANNLPSYEPGSAGYALIIHEVGHALGLKHPFDDGGTGRPTLNSIGLSGLNIDWATVMAYSDDFDLNRRYYDPANPMLLDVIALQYIYGPNMSTNSADGAYYLLKDGSYYTYWDAAGKDLISAVRSNSGWEIKLSNYDGFSRIHTELGYAIPTSELTLSSPLNLRWLMGRLEDAEGSAYSDTIYGNSIDNQLIGHEGNDALYGSSGSDSIVGGQGSDYVEGGDGNDFITYYVGELRGGNDTYWGGLGDDTVLAEAGSNYLRGSEGNDVVSGGSGFDDMHGNQGNDTLYGNDGEDWVVGGKDNDLLFGDAAWDIVYGNMGNDTIEGGAGNDWVRGGQGDDTVMGGAGDDWIWGDKGNDTISGGAGADIFYSLAGAAIDRITDFSYAAGDRLKLEGSPSRTITQVGFDVLVDMGNGDQVILVGVSLSSLGAGWIT